MKKVVHDAYVAAGVDPADLVRAEKFMNHARPPLGAGERAAGMSAPAQTAYTAAYDRGREVGTKAERDRVRTILNCAEGLERPKLARELALEMDVDVAAAKRILALAPKEPRQSYLAQLMAQAPNPKVGVDHDYVHRGDRNFNAIANDVYAAREMEQNMAFGAERMRHAAVAGAAAASA
jgi:hypothetical protein